MVFEGGVSETDASCWGTDHSETMAEKVKGWVEEIVDLDGGGAGF